MDGSVGVDFRDGGLARVKHLGETRALCNVKKLQAEGRPGLAGLTGVGSLAQKFGAKIRRRAILD
jgi:hypothetical protein